jgi:hypothetical protein
MSKLLDEILVDLRFIRGHALQPKWFKVLKVLILLAALVGFYLWLGLARTVAFFAIFFLLMLVVHLTYRVKTHKFTQSWLDFIVVEENGVRRAKSIGIFYYLSILINAAIAFAITRRLF